RRAGRPCTMRRPISATTQVMLSALGDRDRSWNAPRVRNTAAANPIRLARQRGAAAPSLYRQAEAAANKNSTAAGSSSSATAGSAYAGGEPNHLDDPAAYRELKFKSLRNVVLQKFEGTQEAKACAIGSVGPAGRHNLDNLLRSSRRLSRSSGGRLPA